MFLFLILSASIFLFVLTSYAQWHEVRLTNDSAFSDDPRIASDRSGNIHVVWEDNRDGNYEIYYKKRTAASGTWESDVRLTNDSGGSGHPSIATDSSGNIHVVWADSRDGNTEVYYNKWTAATGTWGSDLRLTIAPAFSTMPSIACDPSGNAHVTWYDDRDGNNEIYYKKRTAAGTWDVSDFRVTNNAGNSICSTIASDPSGNVHVTWFDDRDGNSEIYYKKRTAAGVWDVSETRLTNDSSSSVYPSIASDPSGNMHVVWEDYRDVDGEIYYKKWPSPSGPWGSDTRLTDNGGLSIHSSVASDPSGKIHVVWADNSDGNYEIYYDLESGSISGTITLSPAPPAAVSVEVVASRGGTLEGRNIITYTSGSPSYLLDMLAPGNYSVEAHAPGYEIKSYPNSIPVVLGQETTGKNVALAQGWPMSRQDRWHTGSSADTKLSPPLLMKWSYAWTFNFAPVVLGDAIYAGYASTLQKIGTDGKFKWSYYVGLGGNIDSSPLISGGTVYFSDDNFKFYAIKDNGGTAALKWSFPVGGQVFASSPSMLGGVIYFGRDDGKLYAVVDNGGSYTLKWSFGAGAEIHTSPLVAGDKVYFGANNNRLFAIDLGSGQFKWSFVTGAQYIYSSPAIAPNKTIYFGSYDCRLYAVKDDGGYATFQWSFKTNSTIVSSPAILNGVVYIGSRDCRLYAILDNGNSTYTFLWSYPTGGWVDESPALANGNVYFTATTSSQGNSWLFAVKDQGLSGYQLLWSFEKRGVMDSTTLISPVIFDGVLYVGDSFDQVLYAFDSPGSIEGTVVLTPEAAVSVEVEASQNGIVKGRTVFTYDPLSSSNKYTINMLASGSYSIEAHAPGYEIKTYKSDPVISGSTTPGPSISLAAAWPMIKQDKWRMGNSPDALLTPPFVLKWSFPVGQGGGSTGGSAVISNNSVFYAGTRLYAMGIDGSFKWSFISSLVPSSSPLVADNVVYFGSTDNRLYALKITADGNFDGFKWSYPTGDDISDPLISNGVVYFGSYDNKLYAVSTGGTLKWSFPTGNDIAFDPPAVDGNTVFFSSGDGRLYGIGTDGSFKWSFAATLNSLRAPVAFGGRVYAGSQYGVLFSLGTDGSYKWSYNTLAGTNNYSSPSISDGVIYYATWAGLISGVDMGGNLVWSYQIPSVNTTFSSPAIAKGILYIGSDTFGNKMHAIRISDKQALWSFNALANVGCSPAVNNGVLYFASSQASGGVLYAFETAGSIEGTISLVPQHDLTLEVEASQNGVVKGRAIVNYSGALATYIISGLCSGSYSIEAHAPGYEIKTYGPASVESGNKTIVPFTITLSAAWPMFSQDQWHTGNSPDTGLNPPLALKWSFYVGQPVKSSPAVYNGTIYVGANDNNLYAVKEDGSLKWSYATRGDVLSSPAVKNGMVYFSSYDNSLYAIEDNVTNANFKWSIQGGDYIISSPAISNGMVYMGSYNGTLFAVREDGSLKWSYTLAVGRFRSSSPAVSDGVIYIGSWSMDAKLYAFRQEDGSIKWSYDTGNSIFDMIESSPLVSNGSIYFGALSRIYALKDMGSSFQFKWSLPTESTYAELCSPSMSNGIIYTSGYNKLYAIQDNGNSYIIKWSYPLLPAPADALSPYSSPTIAGGVVYLGSRGNRLYAVQDNGDSYALISSFETNSDIDSSPAISNGVLYIGSDDGHLYAFSSSGSLSGTITLTPEAPSVSVEVEASQNGAVKGRAVITGGGGYTIFGLFPGMYSVEAHAPGYEIKPYAGSASVEANSTETGVDITLAAAWPMFRQDRWHTGNSPDTGLTPPLAFKWSFPTGFVVYSSPSISNETIYVGSYDNKLYAIQDNGSSYTFKWSFPAGHYVYSSPCITNGIIYVGSFDNNLYAIQDNGSSYTLKWSFTTGNDVNSSPFVSNGIIYVGSNDNNLYAIKIDGGTLKWSFRTGNYVASSPSISNGIIYVGSDDSKLYAIQDNGNSYTFKWSFPTLGIVRSSPSVSNGRIYVGSFDGRLYVIQDNGNSYTFKWSLLTGSSIYSSVAVSKETIYVGSNDNNLYAIKDNLDNTYTFKWSFPTEKDIASSPSISNGIIYVGSNDNKLYAIQDNGSSYTPKWSFATGGLINASPSISHGLYIGSADNNLYAFESGVPAIVTVEVHGAASGMGAVELSQNGAVVSSKTFEVTSDPYKVEVFPVYKDSYLVEASVQGYTSSSETVSIDNSGTGRTVSFTLSPAWTRFHQDRWSTGYSSDPSVEAKLAIAWKKTNIGDVVSSPVLLGDNVYYGANETSGRAVLYSTGANNWSFPIQNGGTRVIVGAPCLYNGVLYFASNALYSSSFTEVYAVDPSTGVQLHLYSIGGGGLSEAVSIECSPVAANGTLYFGTVAPGAGTPRFYALNASNLSFKWSYALPSGANVKSSPVVAGGRIYFGTSSGMVYALRDNGISGSFLWIRQLISPMSFGAPSPALRGNTLYIGDSGGRVYAISAEAGAIKWSYQVPNGYHISNAPALYGNKGVVVIADRRFICLDDNGNSAGLKWSHTATEGAIDRSSPAIANGHIYFGSLENKLFTLNLENGTVEGVVITGGDIISSPAVFGGKVYIGANGNSFYALEGNKPVYPPYNLQQFKSDRVTAIPFTNGWTNELTVEVRFTVSDESTYDTLYPQALLTLETGGVYTNARLITSEPLNYSGTSLEARVTIEALTSGRYKWRALVLDQGGTFASYEANPGFGVDLINPTAEVLTPKNGSYAPISLASITGDAWDSGGSEVLSVEVSVKKVGTSEYWTGTTWEYLATRRYNTAEGTSLWSYAISNTAWVNGGSYEVRTRARDLAGNVSTPESNPLSYSLFTIDATAPALTITSPTAESPWLANTDLTISWIATSESGFGSPAIRVYLSTGEAYPLTFLFSSSEAISSSTYHLPVTDTRTAEVRIEAIDSVGNVTTAENSFIIDNFNPQVSIISPTTNESIATIPFFRDVDKISGEASDSASGVSYTNIAIYGYTSEAGGLFRYWTGSGWDASQTWVSLPGGTTWEYNSVNVSWETFPYPNGWFSVMAIAYDRVGHYNQPTKYIYFDVDWITPESRISTPETGRYYSSFPAISGTAEDRGGSGLASVEVTIKKVGTNEYWSGSSFGSLIPVWLTTSGLQNWNRSANLPPTVDGASYEVRSRAIDAVSNVEVPLTYRLLTIDATAPQVKVTSPTQESKWRGLTTRPISYEVTDPGGGGVTIGSRVVWIYYSLNYGNSYTLITNEVYPGSPATYSWSIPGGINTTEAKVRVEVKDSVGNLGTGESFNKFVIDSTPPKTTILRPVATDYWNGSAHTISWISTDEVSGLGGRVVLIEYTTLESTYPYLFITNEVTAGSGVVQNYSWTVPPTWNVNTAKVRIRVLDLASNEGIATSETFIIDNNRPTSLIRRPINGRYYAGDFGTLTGEATDLALGAGISTVELTIRKVGPASNNYWTGSTWGALTALSTTFRTIGNLSGTWESNFTLPTWTNGTSYEVTSKSIDRALNSQLPFTTSVFTIDATAPLLTIISPTPESNWKGRPIGGPSQGLTISWIATAEGAPLPANPVNIYVSTGEGRPYQWLGSFPSSGSWSWPILPEDINTNTATVMAYVVDSLGNVRTAESGPFTIDSRKPEALRIITPVGSPNSPGPSYGDVDLITGEAADFAPGSGLSKVQIVIKRMSDWKTWKPGTGWVTEGWGTYIDASGTGEWSYDSSSVTWEVLDPSNRDFVIYTRPVDKAGWLPLIEQYSSFEYVSIDDTSPESWVITPEANGYYRSLPTISGTAEDRGGAGLSSVEVLVKMLNPSVAYWNGSTWIGSEFWLPATGTPGWNRSSGLPGWDSGSSYEVQSRAYDNVGLRESPKPGNRFLFDALTPEARITIPSNEAFYSALSSFTGEVTDPAPSGIPSGISNVWVALRDKYNGRYWDGEIWQDTFTSKETSVYASTWEYTDVPDWSIFETRTFEVKAWAIDRAGNYQTIPYVASFEIDTFAPIVNVLSPEAYDGAFKGFYRDINSITGEVIQSGGAGISTVEVRIKDIANNNYWTGSTWGAETWLAANGTTSWDFDSSGVLWQSRGPTGTSYEVMARAVDVASNVGTSEPDMTVWYDRTPLSIEATDPTSGETGVSLDKLIEIDFTESAVRGTLNGNITPECNVGVDTWGLNDRSVFITHDQLTFETTYAGTVYYTTTDLAGNPMASDYFFTFVTSDETAVQPPYVRRTFPASDEVQVLTTTNITVEFSEGMSAESVRQAFTISPSTTGAFSWNPAETTVTFAPQYGLAYFTTYEVTVSTTAEDKTLVSMEADFVWSFWTQPTAPVPPLTGISFEGTAESTSKIRWNWNDISYEAGYLLRGMGPTPVGTREIGADTITASDEGLSANTRYTRQLTAYNMTGAVTSSAVARYTWANTPSGLSSPAHTASSVTLNWNLGNSASYEVQRGTMEAGPWLYSFITREAAYVDTTVQSGTLYWYRIGAINWDWVLNPNFSTAISVETTGIPASPEGFYGTVTEAPLTFTSTREILWKWTATNDVVNYILVSGDGTSIYTLAPSSVNTMETGLVSNKAYKRYLLATNEAGYSRSTREATVFTRATRPWSLLSAGHTATTITLTFEGNGTTYAVERSTNEAAWILAGTTTETIFVDQGLPLATSYYYHVRGFNGDGVPTDWYRSVVEGTDIFTTTATPSAPSNLTGEAISTSEVKWYWNATGVTDEYGFYIISAETKAIMVVATADATTTTEGSLASNVIYNRKVKSFNDAGSAESVSSYEVATWALTPTNLSTPEVTYNSITVTWSGNGSSYEVMRATDEAGVPASFWESAGRTTEPALLDDADGVGLEPGAKYWHRVFAFNRKNVINPISSEAISAETVGIPVPPLSGFSFEGSATATNEISWSWSTCELTSYYLLTSAETGVPLKQVTATSTLESGLVTNMRYARYAVATNEAGSITSTTDAVYTFAPVPTALTWESRTAFTIGLGWVGDGTTYKIVSATGESSPGSWTTVTGETFETGTTETAYLDVNLLSGTHYWYRVAAYNGDGILTELSPTMDVYTIAAPTAPSLVGTAETTASIRWSWNDVQNEEQYILISSDATAISVMPSGTVTTLETGLGSNIPYTRVVRATSEAGFADSNSVTRFTLALTPSNLISPVHTASSITLTWEGNGTTYEVYRTTGETIPNFPFTYVASTNEMTFVDNSGLAYGTKYWYKVRALNGDGIPTAFTPEPNGYYVVTTGLPNVPWGFSGVALSTGEISWSWNDGSVPPNNAVGFYLVSAEGGEVLKVVALSANPISTIEASLASNTLYNRLAKSYNDAGSSESNSDLRATWALTPYSVISPTQDAHTITLTWESDGTSFGIYRSTDESAGPWIPVGNTSEAAYFDNFNLNYSTVYWYRIMSRNSQLFMNPIWSTAISAETTGAPITPPGGFSFEGSAISTNEILWSWSTCERTNYYILTSAETWADLITTLWPSVSTIEGGLSPNTMYTRFETATNDAIGITSETDSVYTLATRPYNLFISSPLPYSALITWESDATTYEVQIATTTEVPLESEWTPYHGTTDEAAFLDGGLSINTMYWYRVIGYNGDGISTEPSSPISILSIEGTSGSPEAPTNFYGTAESSASIRWLWTNISSNEWGFNLRNANDDTVVIAGITQGTTEVLEELLPPNTPEARYIEVYAATFNLNSGSDEVYTLASIPWGVISPTQEELSISLSWEGDGTSYAVEKSATNEPDYVWHFATGEAFGSLPTTEWTDTLVGSGRRYYYRIWAYNGDGRLSGPSDIISPETTGTPDMTPPTIGRIKFNGRAYFRNDVILAAPTITAVISDEVVGTVSLISIEANGFQIYYGTPYSPQPWTDQTGNGTARYEPVTGTFEYTLSPARSLGSPPVNYTFIFHAEDISGNPTNETCFVRVYKGDVEVIGPAMTYPIPFKALPSVRGTGDQLRIAYTLTLNADVSIFMYDISGQVVMRRNYSAGLEGGRAGYNQVEWNGMMDFGGVIGNGIYIYRITSGRKVLATGKVVVLD